MTANPHIRKYITGKDSREKQRVLKKLKSARN